MPGIMTSPSSNNEDKDAWLLKIELKREEQEEINEDEGIKKAMEVQAPAVKEEDILQPHHNLFTPNGDWSFVDDWVSSHSKQVSHKWKYFVEGAYHALKGIIRKLEHLLRSMCDTTSSTTPSSSPPKKET